MEELYIKELNEPDCFNRVVSHPEPEIMENKVKWAFGSTAVNKASGYDRTPVELFKTLKDDVIKVLHSIYVTKSGRPSSGHRIRKGQSSSQLPRRVVLKNVLTTRQLTRLPH